MIVTVDSKKECNHDWVNEQDNSWIVSSHYNRICRLCGKEERVKIEPIVETYEEIKARFAK